MANSYYVYYRVRPDCLEPARERVSQLLARLADRCKVQGRLLAKCDEPALWMEIYESVQDGVAFESTMHEEAVRVAFESLLAPGSSRKTECFVEPPACA
jgi:hypothetical protein